MSKKKRSRTVSKETAAPSNGQQDIASFFQEQKSWIEAWQTSKSVGEVAEKLGVDIKKVNAWAVKVRKLGIPLRRMKKVGYFKKIDMGELREYADSFGV